MPSSASRNSIGAVVIGVGKAHFGLFVERLLAGLQRQRRLRRDHLGIFLHDLPEILLRHDAVDEAVFAGRRGVDGLASEQHLHRLLAVDVAGQRHHRRRAEQADIHAGRRETRRVGADGEVAARDQLAAGCRRQPVDLGDDRLRMGDDRLHHVGAEPHRLLVERPAPVVVGAVQRQFLEIVAGGKHLARRGDHDHAHARVLAGLVERRHDRLHHGDGERVGRWVVQRQPHHRAVAVACDERRFDKGGTCGHRTALKCIG